jgi:hypothetical protein
MDSRTRAPYYRERARGLRISAAESKFADIRDELQEVAKQFDRLADAAERRREDDVPRRGPTRHWSDRD